MKSNGSNGIESIINTERYPIFDPDSPALREVIEWARNQIARQSLCELTDFVRPSALPTIKKGVKSLRPKAHRTVGEETAYDPLPDPSFPEDHPRRICMPYSLEVVAYDQFPDSSPLRRIYELNAFMQFVRRILRLGTIYPYADKLGALNAVFMAKGDVLQWHFDEHDFAISLAIEKAGRGGDFELSPRIRSANQECYSEVRKVLQGDFSKVRRIAMRPGTLVLFEGRYSLHRVSPIESGQPRVIALFCYDTKPDTMGKESQRLTRYGRNN